MNNGVWQGYLREDGRKGVRILVLVIYTVECASHVAQEIARGEDDTHVIGLRAPLRNGRGAEVSSEPRAPASGEL
jgi:hypothetical protein